MAKLRGIQRELEMAKKNYAKHEEKCELALMNLWQRVIWRLEKRIKKRMTGE